MPLPANCSIFGRFLLKSSWILKETAAQMRNLFARSVRKLPKNATFSPSAVTAHKCCPRDSENINVHNAPECIDKNPILQKRKGLVMNIIKIEDSRFLIKYACEDLRSLRSVLQSLQNRADCPDSQDVLAVVIRALEPIIGDIHKAVDKMFEVLYFQK